MSQSGTTFTKKYKKKFCKPHNEAIKRKPPTIHSAERESHQSIKPEKPRRIKMPLSRQ